MRVSEQTERLVKGAKDVLLLMKDELKIKYIESLESVLVFSMSVCFDFYFFKVNSVGGQCQSQWSPAATRWWSASDQTTGWFLQDSRQTTAGSSRPQPHPSPQHLHRRLQRLVRFHFDFAQTEKVKDHDDSLKNTFMSDLKAKERQRKSLILPCLSAGNKLPFLSLN